MLCSCCGFQLNKSPLVRLHRTRRLNPCGLLMCVQPIDGESTLINMDETEIDTVDNRILTISTDHQNIKDKAESTAISKESTRSILQDVMAVAIPGLAACIVEPLLTIIDAVYVSKSIRSAALATSCLAALSINSALFNFLAAITSPLCTSTTALVSKSYGKSDFNCASSGTDHELKKIFINGMYLSFTLGLILMLLLRKFSNLIVERFFGLDVTVHQLATQYLGIRALSLPFVLTNYVVIGYSLGTQTILAPLLSISVAFMANMVGDYWLVHKLQWGLAGAAAATSGAAILGSVIATSVILLKNTVWTLPNFIDIDVKCLGKQLMKKMRTSFAKAVDYVDVPLIKQFFSTSVLLFAASLLNTLTYSSGARIASIVSSGPVSMGAIVTAVTSTAAAPAAAVAVSTSTLHVAAHQVALQLWWFLSYFSSPLALVAQSILPRDLGAGRFLRVQQLLKTLFVGVVPVAVVCTAVNCIVPTCFPGLFTTSTVVQALVRTVTVQSALSQALICVATMMDGVFIGSGRLSEYVTASLLSTGAAWLIYVYSMHRKLGILGAWNGLLMFSAVRAFYYMTRLPALLAGISGSIKEEKDIVTL